MKRFVLLILLVLTFLSACTNTSAEQAPTSFRPTATKTPEPTTTQTPASTLIHTPEPMVKLVFFFDWNTLDPFNLEGTGLNSHKDTGEPLLQEFQIIYKGDRYISDEKGTVYIPIPSETETLSIDIPNTNPYPGQKDLSSLGIQFNITLYEPYSVDYGPDFNINLSDDNCSRIGIDTYCEVGISDGYITSPYLGENYLYSSPWTYDSGMNLNEHFYAFLQNGLIPAPGGGEYNIGKDFGNLVFEYSNHYNRGVPYGYPYILNDKTYGIHGHMLMDVRNKYGEPVYSPIGGEVCQGASSNFSICSGDIIIDVNDIRPIEEWDYGLLVARGQLIGWTETSSNNLAGWALPFPVIHMGNYEHWDRQFTLHHFPFLTAEQIVMGSIPGDSGDLVTSPREEVINNYGHKVHLPHAPKYIGEE